MIQIIKAITDVLSSEFNIPIYSTNTKEVFDKESFFIEVASDSFGLLATDFLETRLDIRITYFPTDSKHIKDVYKMRSDLMGLFFDGLVVNNQIIKYESDIEFTITANNILEMLIPLHLVNEVIDTDDGETITELIYK